MRNIPTILPLSIFILMLVAISSVGAPTAAHAATSDVQYTSILDYSANDLLLQESGFTASTTYDCPLASHICSPVSKSTILPPSALSSLQASTTAYYASPDYSLALITTYNPYSVPTEKLVSVQGNTLVTKATLPPLQSLITRVRWSPDGSALILSESDGSTQKYIVATNKLTTLSTTLPPGASWITVSPNGRYIAYNIPNTVTNLKRTYGVIDTVADKGYELTEDETYWDLISEGVRVFAFSPDSTHLLYLDDRSGYQTLYNVTLSQLAKTGLTGTMITAKKYSIEDMQWTNNSSIVMSANRDNPLQWSLYTLNLTSLAISKISDYLAYNSAMLKLGNTVVFQTADANGRMTKAYDTLAHTVSSFQIPGISQSKVGTSNQIIQQDGVYGVYLKPAVATSTLVVWLHGGPDRQDSIEYHSYMSYGGYDWMMNQMKAAGVPVLKIDYPGSIGYGGAFASSIKDGVGTKDASTTMQAISDFAGKNGYKNIYVMGNSYGGYLALKLLVSYPTKIAGAYSLSGVTDWPTLIQNIPSSIFSLDFMPTTTMTTPMLYAKASIINNLNVLTNQKILIVQGDADSEVPYDQSVLMDAALTAASKTHEFITLPGEDHIYQSPASYTLICNKALEMVGLPDSSLCTMQ
jgi:dipeptidyl aminopeptidase/acylaminoacyl peptidase